MSVVSQEQAFAEINAWMEFKKLSDIRREALAPHAAYLATAIMSGDISIDDTTKVITQKLRFEIGGEKPISELKYKPRITGAELRTAMTGETDEAGMNFARISAATGIVKGIVRTMDTEDLFLAGHIVVFFSM